jgi:hypothetical protein
MEDIKSEGSSKTFFQTLIFPHEATSAAELMTEKSLRSLPILPENKISLPPFSVKDLPAITKSLVSEKFPSDNQHERPNSINFLQEKAIFEESGARTMRSSAFSKVKRFEREESRNLSQKKMARGDTYTKKTNRMNSEDTGNYAVRRSIDLETEEFQDIISQEFLSQYSTLNRKTNSFRKTDDDQTISKGQLTKRTVDKKKSITREADENSEDLKLKDMENERLDLFMGDMDYVKEFAKYFPHNNLGMVLANINKW